VKAAWVAAPMALVLVAPASGRTTSAVEARYSAAYRNCLATGDAAKGVTSGMLDCNGAEIERQDARLNRTYRTVMARLAPPAQAKLRASERAWIGQRDRSCRRDAAVAEGGTLASVIYSGCILDRTIERTMWLERYRR
jgi:uncharacterized protein YecT (DUF1311 family)